jgi:glycosyltransferase involved in cell wall biosynthesis
MSKNVLMVSYTFPPTGGAGVQRISKFVKYLGEFGWKPIILTPSNPSVPLTDESMLKDIPEGTRIVKSITLEPSFKIKGKIVSESKNYYFRRLKSFVKILLQKLLLPDYQVLWWPGLFVSLVYTVLTNKIDCIFATSPPFSALVPPVVIGKLFKIPIVIDFRDEWVFVRENFENASRGKCSQFLDIVLERFVTSNSDRFIVASGGYISSIANRHKISEKNGIVITNGFDDDDIQRYNKKAMKQNILVSYIGTVWRQNSLSNFISACLTLSAMKPHLFKNVTLRIIGRVVESEKESLDIDKNHLRIEVLDYLDHDKAISQLKDADILLLTLSNLPGAERIIPGKTFEYMASGNHIFAIVPHGETKDLLKLNYYNTTFAFPDDVGDIACKMYDLITNIDRIRNCEQANVEIFTRRHLTQQLANVFDNVSN